MFIMCCSFLCWRVHEEADRRVLWLVVETRTTNLR